MKKKRNLKVYIPLALVIIAVLIGGIYWFQDYTGYIRTDDAVIASDVVSISPKIMGRISKLYVEEGDTVRRGQLIAELDSTDLLAQKQQIMASKVQSESGKLQSEANYQLAGKNIAIVKIAHEKAKEDFERGKIQFNGGVITKEQYDHLKKAMETSDAQLQAAGAQLTVSKTQINSSQAAISTVEAQIGVLNAQLNNTRLYAPLNGVIAKRWLLAGDIAQPGQSIFTLNANTKFWVQVFLEETKLENLKTGDEAEFSIDAFPDVSFNGKVYDMASTTASQFSLIPPSNASGNFTKVTQRVALKISIDGTDNGKQLSAYNFLTGMSAVVKIKRK